MSQPLQIRGAAATVLATLAQRLQTEEWRDLGVQKLLGIAGKLVSDNTPEARTAAKKLIALSQISAFKAGW